MSGTGVSAAVKSRVFSPVMIGARAGLVQLKPNVMSSGQTVAVGVS